MDWQDYIAHHHPDHEQHGALKVLKALESPQLGNRRDIFVYLPPSYALHEQQCYAVIYMQDGQNLFDPKTSFAGAWNVDATLDEVSDEGIEAIVVAIPNMGAERVNEYSPFDDPKHGTGKGDAYLAFIIDTLKPIIDADFRTVPERTTTGIVGSSMGGLISLYAFFKRPDTFGFAGVMSPALWYGRHQIFEFLATSQHVGGLIYVDVGTQEGTRVMHDVKLLRRRLLELGYQHGNDFLCMIDLGAAHHESAWARRMERQLRFFLSGRCRLDARFVANTQPQPT